MKRFATYLGMLLVTGVLTSVVYAQENQDPPPPRIYQGLEFPELPYESFFVSLAPEGLPEATMHYMAGGDPEADPILFIHGNPTWSYLWRNIMPHVESQGRVIAIDLIGMGMSDKPDIGYFFREHAAYLEAFVDELGLENITLVIQDWGSGLGLDYAARNPERIKGIALFEAMLPPAQPIASAELAESTRQFIMGLRTPGVGEVLAMSQNVFVENFMVSPAGAFFGLSEEELNAYRAPFPTPESRLPVWRWPNEIPIDGSPTETLEIITSFHRFLERTDLPMLYMFGNEGGLHRSGTVARLEANVDNVVTTWIGAAGHFAQEDQPDAIGAAISVWYQFID